MRELDQELLRRIAGFTAENGRAVSLVLDLDPSATATAGELASRVNALVGEAGRRVREDADDLDQDGGASLEAEIDRIRAYFDDEFERSEARSVAVYAAGAEEELLDVRLTTPWREELLLGRHFAVAPLLPTAERDRTVVVAIVDRRRGTIARLERGRLSEPEDLSSDTPGQHSKGGSSQARFERSVEREVDEHFDNLARRIGEEIEAGSNTLLVAVCPEEQRNAFLEALPPHAREAFVDWITAEAHVEPAELRETVDELVEKRLESEARVTLEQIAEAGSAGRAARGWEEVLHAAWNGAVDTLVVDGSSTDAWECPNCGRGTAAAGTCPIDEIELEPADGGALESASRGTIQAGGRIRIVSEELMDDTPAAALLRFPLPESR